MWRNGEIQEATLLKYELKLLGQSAGSLYLSPHTFVRRKASGNELTCQTSRSVKLSHFLSQSQWSAVQTPGRTDKQRKQPGSILTSQVTWWHEQWGTDPGPWVEIQKRRGLHKMKEQCIMFPFLPGEMEEEGKDSHAVSGDGILSCPRDLSLTRRAVMGGRSGCCC